MSVSPLNDETLEKVSGGTEIPYLVCSGDTIETIAKKFHCTVEQICRWNNIHNPLDIKVGQKIVIRF